MSRQIFPVFFLLLLVCCQLCELGYVASSLPGQKKPEENTISDFFELEEEGIKYVYNSAGNKQEESKITAKQIGPVFLAANKEFLVALAEVIDGDSSDGKINILAKFINTNENNWGDEAIKAELDKWKPQLAAEIIKKQKDAVIKSFAVVAENDKIYYFMVSDKTLTADGSPDLSSTPKKWHVKLIESTITDGNEGKAMKWTSSDFDVLYDDIISTGKLSTQTTNILPFDGFAFVTNDNNILFFMKSKTKGGNENIVAVFEFNVKNKGNAKLELLPVDISKECYPLFFQWGEEIIMAPSSCLNEQSQNVKVFNKTTKKTFDDTDKLIARLRDFLKDKNNFATALIKTSKNVLLFTQQKTQTDKNVYLWMTDGKRVSLVGIIVKEVAEPLDMSIVYTNKELFALHQQYKESGEKDDNKFTLRRLKEQLENITNILEAWEKDDDNIKRLCKDTDNKQSSICTTPLPADVLVGFLHNNFNKDRNEWKDEYYYTNATVHNGQLLPNGLQFSGVGAGAQWIVGKEKEDQPYSFINPGFTLIATVIVGNKKTDKQNSILGVSFTDKDYVGLWCIENGKWGVKVGTSQQELTASAVDCRREERHYVAITFKNKKVSLFVDGEQLKDLNGELISVEKKDKDITHFYFGAYIDSAKTNNKDESYVTVTNAYLYNRPLDAEVIGNFKKYVKPAEVPKSPDNNRNTTPQGEEQQPPPPPDPIGDETKEDEKVTSSSRTEDGCVGGGVRVFSLLLPLLCVSALLLHL